jgi:hypothetical protein
MGGFSPPVFSWYFDNLISQSIKVGVILNEAKGLSLMRVKMGQAQGFFAPFRMTN